MRKISPIELKKMWCVVLALLVITSLEFTVSHFKLLNVETLKWGIILLTTAKVLFTVAYFIYLKQRRKKFISIMLLPSLFMVPVTLFVLLMEKGVINL